MKGLLRILSLAIFFIAPLVCAEDEQRDFYAEPGMNPFKTAAGQDVTENIDPFSGNIQLSYVDMTIPGNGGMDINITRIYNLPQSIPSYNNPYGYGWTMHFGRITIGSGSVTQLCGTGAIGGGDTRDNPSIEMPDGGREILVHSAELADGTFISKSNWIASCIDPNDYTQGVEVTAPNGTVYFMQEHAYIQGEDGSQGEPAPFTETWFTNQIVDTYGNTLDITYLSIASGMKLISQLDASDGRQVLFSYLDENDQDVSAASNSARLSEVTANNQTWQYLYNPISEVSTGWGGIQHYTLDQVVRPDGTSWNYDYGLVNADPDYNRITKVTYPFGGEVNYTYQKFKPYSPNDTFEIVAIDSKTQTNPGHASGTWTYNFQPGSVLFQDLGFTEPNNFGRKADRTEITTPAGIEHVYHAGYWSAVGLTNVLFQMGLKLRHDFLAVDPDDGSLSVIKSIRNSWSFRSISDEDYRQGILSSLWDDQVYVPVLESEFTSIYGYGSRTDYSSHDAFGHPGIVTEYSNYLNIGDKVTTKTYVNDTTNWFIGLLSTEVVSQDGVDKGTVSRTYNANGRPETEDQFGVVTQYSYTSDGDLYQVTDARNNSTTYSNYFRGTPQLESYSDNTQLSRVVNPTGTVASETSGRGHTTAFTYDNLNRLTGIDYPVGTDVSITWASNGKTLTRGSYQEVVEWDGFGRDIKVTRKDVALGFTYDKTFEYDELGRKTFESDPNSTSGITWEYDQLNRITKVINQDNTFKTITYDGANRELHYDEKNNEKEFKYLIFGGPENKYLKDILSPEGVGTFIDYDVYGNIITVFQGEIDPLDPAHYIGYERVYQYDSKFFLTSTINPETGVTLFERDSVGNMLSEKVGDSLTTNYLYDEMNRRELIDYPETTPDVTFTYDDDGNLESVANTNSTRVNHYDENGNLIIEDISIEGNSYQIRYELDTNDNVKNIVYPSGRVVSYMPDALGRPSMVSPYISSITYFPDGSLKQAAYTNGQTVDYTRTDRHWIDKITVSKFSTILDLDYDYDFNGNILSISDLSAPSVNKVMTYDSLNRMSSVSGIWGLSDFEYDGFSNFKKKTNPNSPGLTAHYSYIEESLLLDKITYDELSSWREIKYDQKANIISDNNISLGVGGVNGLLIERNYGFDHAGNLVGASRETSGNLLATGFFQAKYDGNNNRVIKDGTTTGLRTEYVHNNLGVLLGEYEEVIPTYGMEYIYLGSSIVASAKSNMPPVVITEPDKVVANGYLVTIRSLGSYDKDGRIPEFDWQQISGPSVVLNKNGFSATFTAPSVAGPEDMVFQLTGTDDRGGIGSDFLTVTVQPNTPPLANAGTDQTAPAGASVVLDGSGSGDQEEGSLTYLWEQIGGALVSFDSSLASPVFVAPTPTVEELLTFRLTVTDISGLASSDEVVVSVSPNQPPIANAGADYVLVGGYQGVLDGSASVDPEGQPLVYLWAQTAGETVQLFTGGSTASKKFTAPELSSHSALTFELKVTDIGGDISTDSVDITVLSQTVNDDSDVLPDWWEIVNFGDISTYDGDGDPDADGILNSQEYQEATDPNIAEAIPQPVTEINAKAGDGENIIYWESVVSAASYDILWGNTPGFDVASASVIEDVRSPFVHSSLTNGNEYYYRIVAKNNTGSSAGFAEVLAKPGQLDWVQSISVSANAQLLGNGKGYKFFYRKVDDATSDIYGRVFDSYFGQRFDIYNGWTAEENTHVSIDNTEEGKLVGTIDDEGTTFLAAVRTTGNLGAKSLWAYAAWRNDSSWLGTLVETIDRTSHSGNWVLSNVNYIGGVHGVGNGKFYTTFTQNIGISDFLEGGGAFRMMPRKGTCYLTKAPSKFLSCADNTLDVPGSGVLVEVIDVEASVNNQHGTYV
ncbi:MAG TPA: RHS repeat protein [Porticoccus sp.]|nr:RHS repeat protein [Porticoccus sp.]